MTNRIEKTQRELGAASMARPPKLSIGGMRASRRCLTLGRIRPLRTGASINPKDAQDLKDADDEWDSAIGDSPFRGCQLRIIGDESGLFA